MKYPRMDWGRMEAVVNKLGGERGVDDFLSDKVIVYRPTYWRVSEGIVYFSLTSNGMKGRNWMHRLSKKGIRTYDAAEFILNSPKFIPTRGVTYEIAILRGSMNPSKHGDYKGLQTQAELRGFKKGRPEIACLIWDKFIGEEIKAMGLSRITIMQDLPAKDDLGRLRLITLDWSPASGGELIADIYYPDRYFSEDHGLAFVVSETQARV